MYIWKLSPEHKRNAKIESKVKKCLSGKYSQILPESFPQCIFVSPEMFVRKLQPSFAWIIPPMYFLWLWGITPHHPTHQPSTLCSNLQDLLLVSNIGNTDSHQLYPKPTKDGTRTPCISKELSYLLTHTPPSQTHTTHTHKFESQNFNPSLHFAYVRLSCKWTPCNTLRYTPTALTSLGSSDLFYAPNQILLYLRQKPHKNFTLA